LLKTYCVRQKGDLRRAPNTTGSRSVMEARMLRAAIYARYSSSLQRPTSVDDQTALCREAARRFGCEILDGHIYTDEERSGSTAQRPGYQRLMEAAKRREFDGIIVEAQDRLWRDQAEMHTALRRLRFLGVKVFSGETGADLTGRAGSIVAAVTGWRDETFLDSLRDKTRRGLEGQVHRGFSAGGRAYGYHTSPVTDPKRKDGYGNHVVLGYSRVIDKAEAAVVREIFERYAEGETPEAIVKDLNRRKVPSPRGKGWCPTAIRGSKRLGTGILRNPLYAGVEVWNRFRWEKHPDTGKRVPRLNPESERVRRECPDLRIVPHHLWERVRSREAEIEALTQGRCTWKARPPRYLFSGMLRCGVCGANYVIMNEHSYGCAFHQKRGEAVCRNSLRVRRDHLERALLESITDSLYSPEAVEYLTSAINRELAARMKAVRNGQREAPRLREMEARLRQLDMERENVKRAIRNGLDAGLTRETLEEIERERDNLLREQASLKERSTFATEKQVEAVLRVLPATVSQALQEMPRLLTRDLPKARSLLRGLVEEVKMLPINLGRLDAHLEAELTGNLAGAVRMASGETLVVAGGGFEPPTFGL
jgi:site-specific DNA recombinase